MPPKEPKKSVTRSSASQKQRKEILSAATASPPTKSQRNKRSRKKQTSFESPEATKPAPQVVTETKQAKSSNSSSDNSSDGDSTRNDASTGNSSDNSEGNGNAPATMTNQFDAKLEHVLINYLSATGADHHIRKAFIHEQIHTFDEFTIGCNVKNIKTFQRDDGNNNIVPAFNSVKLTLITNVILYYEFLQDDNQETLADNPVNWVLLDFKRWRRNPPVSTNAATVTTAATAAAVT